MLTRKNMVKKAINGEVATNISDGEGEEFKKITIWTWGPYLKAAEYAVEIYQAELNREIEFSVVEMPASDMKDIFMSLIYGNANIKDLPDIILLDDKTLKYCAREKPELFVTFNDYLDIDNYMPFKIAGITCEDGLIYGVPYSSGTSALYYRSDILGELNDNLTWEEFIDIGRQMKANLPNMYLFPLTKEFPQILLQSSGMGYYDKEGFLIFENNYEEGIEMMRPVTELIYRLCWDGELMYYNYYPLGESELVNYIQEIPVAAFIGNANRFSSLKRIQEEGESTGKDIGEWRVTRLPKSEIFSKEVSMGGCSWMVINKDTQYDENGQNIAVDFVMRTFGTFPDLAKRMAKEYDIVPVLKKAIPKNIVYDDRIPWYKQNMALYMGSFGEDIAIINLDNNTEEIKNLYQERLLEGIENQLSVEEVNENFVNDASAECGGDGFGLYTPTEPSGELKSYELDSLWWKDPDIISPLERIEVTKEPARMRYLRYEQFDVYGMAVTAYYEDGSSRRISNYYLKIVPEILESKGSSVTVDLYYREGGREETTSIEVEVVERNLSSLEVVKNPNRTQYLLGETFDMTGMIVKAVYAGGIEREVPLNKLEVLEPSMNNKGTKDIEVFYSDGNKVRATVRVVVVERSLSGLKLVFLPHKEYVEGEIFDPVGMKIEAQYGNEVWLPVEDYYYKNNMGTKTDTPPSLTTGKSMVEVYYKENDTDEMKIEVWITVLSKGSANGKIRQTKLNYECGAGQAAVNVYTGNLEFEHSDVVIGTNDYQAGISHIYNNNGFGLSQNINTYMGKGWKLNVQQYLYEDNNKYLYIDGGGATHIFEKLGDGERCYDTSGLGLILESVATEKTISDAQGNKMYFLGNVLVKTESCHNSNAVRYYNYEKGKLKEIYDVRKPGNKLGLVYGSNGLLEKIECKQNNGVKKSISYYYDPDNNLVRIQETSENNTKDTALFGYKDGKLTYAVDMEDNSALRFGYNDSGWIGEVRTGIVNYTQEYTIIEGIQTPGTDMKSKNVFEYQRTLANSTTVTNEKGIKLLYSFNKQGITTSILEANNGDINDLRTLEKQAGVEMIGSGTDGEKINSKNVWSLFNKQSISSSDDIMSSVFESVKNYRKMKCPEYEYYVCSFWLKIGKSEDSEIKLTVKSTEFGSSTDEGRATFDNTAANSWQLVQIPIKISRREIDSIRFELPKTTKYKIADMRLTYAPSVQYRIGNRENDNVPLDEITEIRFQTAENTEFISKKVATDCYISEKDLQATYLSAYGGKDYILSLCDGTLKYKVTRVKLYHKSGKEFLLGVEKSRRAQFYQETKSPDGSMSVFGELYFKDDRVEQKTVAVKENQSSSTSTEVDYKGKILKESDEYGVTTTYEYDAYGNQTKKTISHQDTTEKLVFEASATDSLRTESSETSYVKTTFDSLFGTAAEVNYRGKTESEANFLTTTFGYNVFKDRLTNVENNAGGRNRLTYDEKGRLQNVTPTGLETAGGYGYGFQYNAFGEPMKHSLIYREAEMAQQLLTEKEIDYAAGTVKDKKYRNAGSADETKVTLDKYGRTSRIEEKSFGENYKTTSFTRQEVNESEGASEVVEMYDPYEDRTYTYSYDDKNNLTGYEVKNNPSGENAAMVLSIKKTGENKVTYNLKPKVVEGDSEITYDFGYDSEITYDGEKLLSPRVTKTICQLHLEMEDGNSSYEYDKLGRIKRKQHKIYNKAILESDVTTNITYKSGTTLKSEIITGLSRSSDAVNTYKFNVVYTKRGLLETSTCNITEYRSDPFSSQPQATEETLTKAYTYDKANRLETETGSGETIAYSYTADGSLETETDQRGVCKQYLYAKGRLTMIKDEDDKRNERITEFGYDNIGNCTHYKRSGTESANMEWERGSLLKEYKNESNQTTRYYYNSQGIRYKKVVGGTEVAYCLDGGKLLLEKRGYKQMSFAYDAEGIIGFYYHDDTPGQAVKKFGTYTYIKDAQGNVVSIVDREKEVARYSYDSWGRCTVVKNIDGIGALNPIRWKSQYYDTESGFYYIDGRYYSPEIRRYISAENPERAMTNAGTLYGLNLYLLCLTNPVGMVYNGYTIETNAEMSYEPDELTDWQSFVKSWKAFWNSPFGKYLSIKLFVAATALAVICPAFAPMYASAVIGVGISLGVGAVIAGYRSLSQGNGFWEGFANHLNENWAQELAISMALAMVTFGVSQAAQAIKTAGANKKLANSTTVCDPKCFIAGTLVVCRNENGEECHKPIEEIEVGDMVWAYDEETGESDWKPVVRLFRNNTKEWYHIFVDGEELVCTGGHPFYVAGKGFIEARKLKVSEKLMLSSGKEVTIEKVKVEQLAEAETTYNFEVEDFHTYYVSEKAVLVHNTCPVGPELPDEGLANSTALRYDTKGKLYSAKTYGADGKVSARIDFQGEPHFVKGVGKVVPHVHQYYYWNGYRNKLPVTTLEKYIGGL